MKFSNEDTRLIKIWNAIYKIAKNRDNIPAMTQCIVELEKIVSKYEAI